MPALHTGKGKVSAASAAETPLPVALVGAPFWDSSGAVALAALDPGIRWWAQASNSSALTPLGAAAAGTPSPKWTVATQGPYVPPYPLCNLSAALKETNFNASALVDGTLQAFTQDGQPYGVPVGLTPTGVACNVEAFRESGATLPAVGWTIDQLKRTCLALKVGITGGKVHSATAVLPPLVGSTKWASGRGTAAWLGSLIDPSIWGAFVVGYGGHIVEAQGQFDLTNAGAIQGLEELVAMALAYGAPVQDLPHSDATARTPFPAAMTFAAYSPYAVPARTTQWVPLPAFPVRSVVPVTPTAVKTAALLSARVPFSIAGPPVPSRVPLQALEAPVVYAQWLYQRTRGEPTLPGLPPPVLADPAVQDGYWGARGERGGPLVDWRDFVVVPANWPPTGFGGFTWFGFSYTKADLLVLQALTQAVASQKPLPGVLASTTQALNAAAQASAPGASRSRAD